MSENRILFAISSNIFILLLLFAVNSTALNNNNNRCASSFCGNIKVSYPFRLSSSPKSCGYDNPSFELECHNNQTIFEVRSRRYIVQDINYELYSIRVVDPSIDKANLSSCPVYYNDYDSWPYMFTTSFFNSNIPVSFINCASPVNSSKYVEGPFCGNSSSTIGFSKTYSYIMVGHESTNVSDVECRVDKVIWSSGVSENSTSLAAIYDDGLGYGVELSWYLALCGECEGFCALEGNRITCKHYCMEDTPYSQRTFKCKMEYWGILGILFYVAMAIGALVALRFLIGVVLLMGLVVFKWRRQRDLPI